MSTHPVFVEFNGQRTRIGTANQAEDGSFVVVLGGFLVVGSAEGSSQRQTGGAPSGATFPNYGRSKGAPISGASMQELEYYGNNCIKSINDPGKARWREKEMALLAAINAEIQRQGGQPIGGGEPAQRDAWESQSARSGGKDEDDIPF